MSTKEVLFTGELVFSERRIPMSSIKISPKHGVNPTIPVCFFCGKPKNEIALMGRMGGKEDIEAPRNLVLDYEPCDECKEHMSKGVALIVVSDRQPEDKRPPMTAQGNQKVYPLGGMLVIKSEAFSNMTGQHFEDGDKCFIDEELYHKLQEGNDD